MKLSTSVKAALAILGAIVLYFAVRSLFPGGGGEESAAAETKLFPVIVETVDAQPWRDEVVIRGRTEAFRKVTVRAETSGVVEATPAEPGAIVEAGALLCRLRIDARQAGLAEARAAMAKAKLDHEAAVQLAAEGFRSETAVAAMRSALDLAKANLEQAEVAVGRTQITAPWAGVFDQRLAETGDFLNIGDPCGVVIQRSPYLIVGAVSERNVAKIKQGDRGVARLATGETLEGAVRVVSTAADPATRTFEVELEVPNEEGTLRDGVTAEFTVFADRREAHRVPRSSLTLDEQGRIGVRLVGEGDIVDFEQVALLGESEEGVWVSGLDGPVRLVTRGQEFVSRGQKVAVASETPP